MKMNLVVVACMLTVLAPALAQSVPRQPRPAAPAKKLGYNSEDPNLKKHKASDRDKSEGFGHKVPNLELTQETAVYPLQNLGALSANNPNSQPSVPNSMHGFKGSTNPADGTARSREEKGHK